jgi:hypothetical protein
MFPIPINQLFLDPMPNSPFLESKKKQKISKQIYLPVQNLKILLNL